MAGLCNKEPWVGVLFNKESLVVVLCNKSQHPTNVQQGGAAHSKGLTFPRYKSLYVRIAYAPRYFSLCLPHSFARRLSIVVTLCPVRRLNSKLVKWIGNRGEILSRARTPTNAANPEKCYICEFFFIAGPQMNKRRQLGTAKGTTDTRKECV